MVYGNRHNRRRGERFPEPTGARGMGLEPGAPREVEGVDYGSSDLAPGLRFFGCSRLGATLSMGGCAARWREAKAPPKRRRGDEDDGGAVLDRFAACRGCPIGAAHAGEEVIEYSGLYGSSTCPRCRKGTTRMIGSRICVSCYNRERERQTGKNARGNAPTKIQALCDVQFRAVIDDKAKVIRAVGVVDALEPAIQTLRTTPGKAVFAYAAPTIHILQADLFARLTPPRRPHPRHVRAPALRRAAAPEYQAQGLLF